MWLPIACGPSIRSWTRRERRSPSPLFGSCQPRTKRPDVPEVVAIHHDRPSGCAAFDVNGTVTAATSSPVTDGAAAVIVASEDYAKKHKLPILARIKSFAVSGIAPEIMGLGPVEASKKALGRAGISVKDLDIIELNEAFGVQALGVIKELGLDESKVNLDGGAIALGHPVGASGARILTTLIYALMDRGKRRGVGSLCIGTGMGIAMGIELCT